MKRNISLLLASALGIVVPQAFAADYYVSPNGDDKAAGTSVETALKTVQAAVEKLEDNTPTTIHLEANATFDVLGPDAIIIGSNKNVTLKGNNTTLKSGDQPFLGDRVITIGSNTDATVSGLILKNGCTRDGIPGGAIFFEGNELLVDSCTFINNEANNSGGAIASRGKNVTITNCVFHENRIFGGYGGAAIIYHCGLPNNADEPGALIIRNTAFTNNISQNDAKGDIIGFHHAYRGSDYTEFYSNVNYFELTNCVFKDNEPGNSPSVKPAASDIYINNVRDDFEMNLVNNIFYNNKDFTIMSSNVCGERDPLIAYNNVFVGELGENMDDPALNAEKEKYGNVVLDAVELTQLGLTPRMQEDNYVTYLPITDGSSILIDKGLSSTTGVEGFDSELIPAADIRGIATKGTKDIGSFEYEGTSGIIGATADRQNMFTLTRNGDEAIVRNQTDSPLTLSVILLDGRCIYNASLQDELVINKADLEIPNGVLIFSANDGNRTESQKVILF
ncbi:MAG TPA: hypothetical protein H9834_07110 [Candidatus Barnesiella excrementavium]|nr:hypothetical protein [Candidatus Barnesiella excrementavium]